MSTATQDGLGIDQIRESIESAFPFEVEKYPLCGPDSMATPHYGLFRDDTSQCVGVAVRKGYVPHTRDDVAALCEAGATAFGGQVAQVDAHWNDGHFVCIAPSSDDLRQAWDATGRAGGHTIDRQSDVVFPRLMIRAGYDGRAFRAELGLQRLVCRNLMSIPVQGKAVSSVIRHTIGLRDKMPSLVKQFETVAGRWDDVVATIDKARQIEVDMADFIRTVYPIDADATKRSRNAFTRRVESIMTRLYQERRALGMASQDPKRATAWEAYNAVQGYVQHDANRHGRPSQMARAIVALDDRAVANASALAFA